MLRVFHDPTKYDSSIDSGDDANVGEGATAEILPGLIDDRVLELSIAFLLSRRRAVKTPYYSNSRRFIAVDCCVVLYIVYIIQRRRPATTPAPGSYL